jgi:hypothetical protein
MSIDDNLQDPLRKSWDYIANENMKNLEKICDDIKKNLDIKFFSHEIIEQAPSFKELLWAIMDEKRDQLLSTDLYKFIEKRIKEKCEEAALNLKTYITFENLSLHNCDQFFKNMTKGGYNSGVIVEMVRYACEKLDLKFNGQVICWGRTSVSPEE